jgi:hypothetical protein
MNNRKDVWAAIILMLVAAFARLIPHLPNFTPTEGLALFGAAYVTKKYWAVIATTCMLFITDFIINNTIARPYFTDVEGVVWFAPYMFFNLIAIIGIVWIGHRMLQKVKITNVVLAAVLASILFFFVTNFGSWVEGIIPYSKDLSGLSAAYMAGIPFFKNTLISNLVFTIILFGTFEMYKSIVAQKALVKQKA